MKVEMRLDRELAAPKLAEEAGIESMARALDVLLGLGQFEIALARYQVGEFGQYFGIFADDFAASLRRDGEAMGAWKPQWPHSLEGFAKEGFIIDLRRRRGRYLRNRSGSWGRGSGFQLWWRRRRGPNFCRTLLDELLKILERRVENRLFSILQWRRCFAPRSRFTLLCHQVVRPCISRESAMAESSVRSISPGTMRTQVILVGPGTTAG